MLQEREQGCDCCSEGEKGVVVKGTCAAYTTRSGIHPLLSLSDEETEPQSLLLWIAGGLSLTLLRAPHHSITGIVYSCLLLKHLQEVSSCSTGDPCPSSVLCTRH